jgi:hypothetical protein
MKTAVRPTYAQSVFVNCPFDAEYRVLLRPMVFTLLHCQLDPYLCTTRTATARRLDQIKWLIQSCRYSIHDLSRCEPNGEPPRFNMPFELGLDLGCHSFGSKRKDKMVLVL